MLFLVPRQYRPIAAIALGTVWLALGIVVLGRISLVIGVVLIVWGVVSVISRLRRSDRDDERASIFGR